jgi:indolepyruvate ferredoxin oxidoreductase, beta subunit
METINFLITGVGGQGTVLASDIMAALGLAAGYDVKKSDILGLSVRGGAVMGHVRWGDQVYSPIVPEGRADFLIAFEVLEGLRWLGQVKPSGTVLVNLQKISPVLVSSGLAAYPDAKTMEASLTATTPNAYTLPAIDMAQAVGNSRTVNIVMLGALSSLLPVDQSAWENVIKERVPKKHADLNLTAFRKGREWMAANNPRKE